MDRKRHSKEQLYNLFSKVASAIANPHRLELLDLLVQAPRTVEELAREAGMSIANTSQHLQRLKQANLVQDERQGYYNRYSLADANIVRLWVEMRNVAARQLADVERALDTYRRKRHAFEAISTQELSERLGRNEVVLLDVRPAVEYQAGHLPNAISLPLDELQRRLNELPRDKTIVAYCRGPYCAFADEALETLAARGWKVARLEEGVAEWELAGYKLEK